MALESDDGIRAGEDKYMKEAFFSYESGYTSQKNFEYFNLHYVDFTNEPTDVIWLFVLHNNLRDFTDHWKVKEVDSVNMGRHYSFAKIKKKRLGVTKGGHYYYVGIKWTYPELMGPMYYEYKDRKPMEVIEPWRIDGSPPGPLAWDGQIDFLPEKRHYRYTSASTLPYPLYPPRNGYQRPDPFDVRKAKKKKKDTTIYLPLPLRKNPNARYLVKRQKCLIRRKIAADAAAAAAAAKLPPPLTLFNGSNTMDVTSADGLKMTVTLLPYNRFADPNPYRPRKVWSFPYLKAAIESLKLASPTLECSSITLQLQTKKMKNGRKKETKLKSKCKTKVNTFNKKKINKNNTSCKKRDNMLVIKNCKGNGKLMTHRLKEPVQNPPSENEKIHTPTANKKELSQRPPMDNDTDVSRWVEYMMDDREDWLELSTDRDSNRDNQDSDTSGWVTHISNCDSDRDYDWKDSTGRATDCSGLDIANENKDSDYTNIRAQVISIFNKRRYKDVNLSESSDDSDADGGPSTKSKEAKPHVKPSTKCKLNSSKPQVKPSTQCKRNSSKPHVKPSTKRKLNSSKPHVKPSTKRKLNSSKPHVKPSTKRKLNSSKPHVKPSTKRKLNSSKPHVKPSTKRKLYSSKPHVKPSTKRKLNSSKPHVKPSTKRKLYSSKPHVKPTKHKLNSSKPSQVIVSKSSYAAPPPLLNNKPPTTYNITTKPGKVQKKKQRKIRKQTVDKRLKRLNKKFSLQFFIKRPRANKAKLKLEEKHRTVSKKKPTANKPRKLSNLMKKLSMGECEQNPPSENEKIHSHKHNTTAIKKELSQRPPMDDDTDVSRWVEYMMDDREDWLELSTDRDSNRDNQDSDTSGWIAHISNGDSDRDYDRKDSTGRATDCSGLDIVNETTDSDYTDISTHSEESVLEMYIDIVQSDLHLSESSDGSNTEDTINTLIKDLYLSESSDSSDVDDATNKLRGDLNNNDGSDVDDSTNKLRVDLNINDRSSSDDEPSAPVISIFNKYRYKNVNFSESSDDSDSEDGPSTKSKGVKPHVKPTKRKLNSSKPSQVIVSKSSYAAPPPLLNNKPPTTYNITTIPGKVQKKKQRKVRKQTVDKRLKRLNKKFSLQFFIKRPRAKLKLEEKQHTVSKQKPTANKPRKLSNLMKTLSMEECEHRPPSENEKIHSHKHNPTASNKPATSDKSKDSNLLGIVRKLKKQSSRTSRTMFTSVIKKQRKKSKQNLDIRLKQLHQYSVQPFKRPKDKKTKPKVEYRNPKVTKSTAKKTESKSLSVVRQKRQLSDDSMKTSPTPPTKKMKDPYVHVLNCFAIHRRDLLGSSCSDVDTDCDSDSFSEGSEIFWNLRKLYKDTSCSDVDTGTDRDSDSFNEGSGSIVSDDANSNLYYSSCNDVDDFYSDFDCFSACSDDANSNLESSSRDCAEEDCFSACSDDANSNFVSSSWDCPEEFTGPNLCFLYEDDCSEYYDLDTVPIRGLFRERSESDGGSSKYYDLDTVPIRGHFRERSESDGGSSKYYDLDTVPVPRLSCERIDLFCENSESDGGSSRYYDLDTVPVPRLSCERIDLFCENSESDGGSSRYYDLDTVPVPRLSCERIDLFRENSESDGGSSKYYDLDTVPIRGLFCESTKSDGGSSTKSKETKPSMVNQLNTEPEFESLLKSLSLTSTKESQPFVLKSSLAIMQPYYALESSNPSQVLPPLRKKKLTPVQCKWKRLFLFSMCLCLMCLNIYVFYQAMESSTS